jgi:hypothetical protein
MASRSGCVYYSPLAISQRYGVFGRRGEGRDTIPTLVTEDIKKSRLARPTMTRRGRSRGREEGGIWLIEEGRRAEERER